MSKSQTAVAVAMIGISMVLLPWRGALADAPTAPASTSQATTQQAAKSMYQNQLICNKTRATGSLVAKKTCTTQARIDAERKAGQRMLHNQRRTGGGAGGTAVLSDW